MLHADEYDRLTGALGLSARTVSSVLLPIADLATVRRGARVAEVEAACARTGFSRFPVAATDGNLIGYLHIKDILETDPERYDHEVADKRIRPLATIRPDDLLHDALETLRRRGVHLGRVVNDDGATVGVVALEDLLEELVGEIRDGAHVGGRQG